MPIHFSLEWGYILSTSLLVTNVHGSSTKL
jgi:hypothetical protein